MRTVVKRLFLLFLLFPAVLCGQGAADALESWERAWIELETREGLSSAERRRELTGLLLEQLGESARADAVSWERLSGLLDQWEAAPAGEEARDAYLGLLGAVAGLLEGSADPFPENEAFRGYLKKGLTLARSPMEEGRFLYYLAQAWLRGGDRDSRLTRRASVLLRQAADILPKEPPLDGVHLALADLNRRWSEAEARGPGTDDGDPYLTRAVRHYRAILDMGTARPGPMEAAGQALEGLLEPQIELSIGNRYLPGSDIRIAYRTRNIRELTLTLRGLAPGSESSQLDFADLSSLLHDEDASGSERVHEERFVVESRYPHDWQEGTVRPGITLPAGWYGVTLEGDGLVREDILLVTPLEVAALARRNGDLLVWVSDGETGQPYPGAQASVLDADGEETGTFETDAEGKALLPAETIAGWEEIHLHSEMSPGHLRREDLSLERSEQPWILTYPDLQQPGGLVQWSLLAHPEGARVPGMESIPFLLPDGRLMQAEPLAAGDGWSTGTLELPADLEESGPLYALPSEGRPVNVGHVLTREPGQVALEFSGDRLHPRHPVFLATTPVGVQVSPVFGSETEATEFIRLKVTRVERSAAGMGSEGETEETERILVDEILGFDPADQRGLFWELSEVGARDEPVALQVEVLALEDGATLARAWFALSPYEEGMRLTVPEHLARPGQPIRINYEREAFGPVVEAAVDGELVIYRETWESRYVHRKRGTPLSEEEYLALPDRSLLGAAKTDYRLASEGYVREELRRISHQAEAVSGSFEVPLEDPGYYNIEFEPADALVSPLYPEGPLEVWVVAEEMDPRSFRSDQARLILEPVGPDAVDLLLLPGAGEPSILLELESDDGRALTRVMPLRQEPFHLMLEGPGFGEGLVCRAILVGNRQTTLLSAVVEGSSGPEWKLEALDGFYGLNPGVPFDWALEGPEAIRSDSVLWAFLPDSAEGFSPERLKRKSRRQLTEGQRQTDGVAYLSEWLPFADPFDSEQTDRAATGGIDRGRIHQGVESFLSRYPEIRGVESLSNADLPGPFAPVVEDQGVYRLKGTFPGQAGRWRLTVFHVDAANRLHRESWQISTELPIRSRLSGPADARAGDLARFILEVENTAGSGMRLDLERRETELVRWTEAFADILVLDPNAVRRWSFPAEAAGSGSGSLEFILKRSGQIESETRHAFRVEPVPDFKEVVVAIAKPQRDAMVKSFEVSGFSSAELVVASSLGSLLSALRDAMDAEVPPADPRIGMIRDWVLQRVLTRHGMQDLLSPDLAEEPFPQSLLDQQQESGGWSWLEGGAPDPWLSAFILWSLDLFLPEAPEEMGSTREAGRRFLNSVLVDESIGLRSRLMALRALAAEGFYSPDNRPSRIEARTFLDLIRQRSQMDAVSLSMLLQVAKAYRFREEVDLLDSVLRERLSADGRLEGAGFRESALFALALEDSRYRTTGPPLLQNALEAFSRNGLRGGWEQLAGFLDLAAGFYWEGDFNVDGTAVIRVGETDAFTVSLGAEVFGSGSQRRALSPGVLGSGRLEVELDTSSALSPVYLALTGIHHTRRDLMALSGTEIDLKRHFYEETLLRGTRQRTLRLDPEAPAVEAGDRLQLVITLPEGLGDQVGDIIIPVPGGLELVGARLTTEEALTPQQVLEDTPNPLQKRLLTVFPEKGVTPVIEIEYEALWPGEYAWPAPRLWMPRTGESYRLDQDRRITVRGEG